jgi:hypothetical protein
MKNTKFIVLGIAVMVISGCDFINRSSRTMDTMLGGDYEVHVQGFERPFQVNGGKITSQPDKGYYIFYPTIDGKKRLVQSPIHLTTIIEKD